MATLAAQARALRVIEFAEVTRFAFGAVSWEIHSNRDRRQDPFLGIPQWYRKLI